MQLDQYQVELLTDAIPALEGLLPHPDRHTSDEVAACSSGLALESSATDLRAELCSCRRNLLELQTSHELPEAKIQRADDLLNEIMILLSDLIVTDKPVAAATNRSPTDEFPKLEALRNPACPAVNLQSHHLAGRCRILANRLGDFNRAMVELRLASSVDNTELARPYPDKDQHINDLEKERRLAAELDLAKKFRHATSKIEEILKRSECQGSHSAFIHLSGFEDAGLNYLMEACNPAMGGRWGEIRWAILEGNPPAARKATNICKEMEVRCRTKKVLRVRIRQDGTWQQLIDRPKDPTRAHNKPPDIFLSAAVSEENGLSKVDRLGIAVRLAMSLFFLLGTPLLLEQWKSKEMPILLATQKGHPEDENRVYYRSKLSQDEVSTNKFSEQCYSSFIVEFAALLWEIFFAQEIIITEDDEETGENGEILSLYNALDREITKAEAKFVEKVCLQTINNCLLMFPDFIRDGDQRKREEQGEDLRKRIYRDIFEPLQEQFENYGGSPRITRTVRDLGKKTSVPQVAGHSRPSGQTKHIPFVSVLSTTIPETCEFHRPKLLASDHREIRSSRAWLDCFDRVVKNVKSKRFTAIDAPSQPVRVAVLDTGCNTQYEYFQYLKFFEDDGGDRLGSLNDRWYDCLHESPDEPRDDDPGLHGTALCCLMLRLASLAEVYVVRIARDESGLASAEGNIAEAILHCAREWKVDVISMSFGFAHESGPIKRAIRDAENMRGEKILFFAAANNGGLNEPEMFPSFHDSVISVRGTDYTGEFVSLYNPGTRSHSHGPQYGTLAKDVPCWRVEGSPLKSGCSVATPIMASIAAMIISLVDAGETLDPQDPNRVRTSRGMLSVFKYMTDDQNSSDGRFYLSPWELCGSSTPSTIRHALSKLPLGNFA